MPTQPYHNAKGDRLPGTTTIISRFKESGGLIHWAWQLGVDGKDYRKERDKAADAGTIAHAMIQCKHDNRSWADNGYDEELLAKARRCLAAEEEWERQTRYTVFESECPLVSEQYQFGGTLDAMLIHDRLSLGDWKTSNSIYSDYLIQLAAYGILWRENYPDLPIEGGYHLLRFSKEGDFAHHWWGELADAERAFILMRELYDLDKKLKGRV